MTDTADLDEDERIERTLFHLHRADNVTVTADHPCPLGPAVYPHDWCDLVLAAADAVHRGWLFDCVIQGDRDRHSMNYRWTSTGRRALSAYRVRLQNTPVTDETESHD